MHNTVCSSDYFHHKKEKDVDPLFLKPDFGNFRSRFLWHLLKQLTKTLKQNRPHMFK
jgi:hypothetical protein